jgi:hypothetical protein
MEVPNGSTETLPIRSRLAVQGGRGGRIVIVSNSGGSL